MSLASRISDLATRAGQEAKSLRTLINGNVSTLSALTTTVKTNLVAAINELNVDKIETSLIPGSLGATVPSGSIVTVNQMATAFGYWPFPITYNTTSGVWPARTSVVPAWWPGAARYEALTTVNVVDPPDLQTNDVVVDLYAS